MVKKKSYSGAEARRRSRRDDSNAAPEIEDAPASGPRRTGRHASIPKAPTPAPETLKKVTTVSANTAPPRNRGRDRATSTTPASGQTRQRPATTGARKTRFARDGEDKEAAARLRKRAPMSLKEPSDDESQDSESDDDRAPPKICWSDSEDTVYEPPAAAAIPESIAVCKGSEATPELSISSTAMGDLLAVYAMLRAFSWQLRLSPFTFEDFCKGMSSTQPTQIMDETHVCVLRALAIDETAEEREEHHLDLGLLDTISWPCYVWELLRVTEDPLASHEWKHRKGIRVPPSSDGQDSVAPTPASGEVVTPAPESEPKPDSVAAVTAPEPVSEKPEPQAVQPHSDAADVPASASAEAAAPAPDPDPDATLEETSEPIKMEIGEEAPAEPQKPKSPEEPRPAAFAPLDEGTMDAQLATAPDASTAAVEVFSDRGPRLPQPQPEYYALPIEVKASILSRLCDHLVDCTTFRAEIDRRESGAEHVTGRGGENGAFAIMTAEEKKRAEARAKQQQQSDANTDTCVLCGLGGNLLCCDGCPAAYHMRCLGESGKNIGDGEWLCPECTVGGRGEAAGIRLPVAARNIYNQPHFLLNGAVFKEALPAVESCGCHAKELTTHVPAIAYPAGPEAQAALAAATRVRTGEEVPLPSSYEAVKDPPKWPEDAANSGPEGYNNKYRNGWNAAAQALRSTVEETKKRKNKTENWIPTGTCGRVTVAELPEPLPMSRFQWVQIQGRPQGRATVRCGKCHTCKRPTLRKGCMNPIVLRAGSAGAATDDSQDSSKLSFLIAFVAKVEREFWTLADGPWANEPGGGMQFRARWAATMRSATCAADLASAIMQLEAAMRPIAFTKQWSEGCKAAAAADAGTGDDSRGPSRGVSRATSMAEINGDATGDEDETLGDGGQDPYDIISEKLVKGDWIMDRKHHSAHTASINRLPSKVLKRAARQSGRQPIPGIRYKKMEWTLSSPQMEWVAEAEAVQTCAQLAIVLRKLDAALQWDAVTKPRGGADIPFANATIRGKRPASDGNGVEYLVESRPADGAAAMAMLQQQQLASALLHQRLAMGHAMAMAQAQQAQQAQQAGPSNGGVGVVPMPGRLGSLAQWPHPHPQMQVQMPPGMAPPPAMEAQWIPRPSGQPNMQQILMPQTKPEDVHMQPASAAVLQHAVPASAGGPNPMIPTSMDIDMPTPAFVPQHFVPENNQMFFSMRQQQQQPMPSAQPVLVQAPASMVVISDAGLSVPVNQGEEPLRSPSGRIIKRCGQCVNCLNPHFKKACVMLANQREEEHLANVVATYQQQAEAAWQAEDPQEQAKRIVAGAIEKAIDIEEEEQMRDPDAPAAMAAKLRQRSLSVAGASSESLTAAPEQAAPAPPAQALSAVPTQFAAPQQPQMHFPQFGSLPRPFMGFVAPPQPGPMPVWMHERDLPLWLIRTYEERCRREAANAAARELQAAARSRALQDSASQFAARKAAHEAAAAAADSCGVCSSAHGDKPELDALWICCDTCNRWFHGECVAMTQDDVDEIPEDDPWNCPGCKMARQKAERAARREGKPGVIPFSPSEMDAKKPGRASKPFYERADYKAGEQKALERLKRGVVEAPSPPVIVKKGKLVDAEEEIAAKRAGRSKRKREEEAKAAAEPPPPIYCPVCQQPDFGRPLVECDQCSRWFHYECVGTAIEAVELAVEQNEDLRCAECQGKRVRPPTQAAIDAAIIAAAERAQAEARQAAAAAGGGGGGGGSRPKKARLNEGSPVAPVKPFEFKWVPAASKVLGKLYRFPAAAAFCDPVSTEEVPDYADIVQRPMDIGTLRDMVSKLDSPLDVVAAVELIVHNCVLYNGDQSEYTTAARDMLTEFQRLWSNEGLPFTEQQWAEAKAAADTAAGTSQKLTKTGRVKTIAMGVPPGAVPAADWTARASRVLASVSRLKSAEHFMEPVPRGFLNYHDVIDRPIDLGTIAKRLSRGQYSTPVQVASDVALVWRNCRTFNEPDAPVVLDCNIVEASFNRQWAASGVYEMPGGGNAGRGGVGGGASGSGGGGGAQRPRGGDWKEAARTVLYKVINFAPNAGWFAEPVSETDAPDYRQVVARPMDLGTVLAKLKGDAYSSPSEMLADVRLVWSNAEAYNGPNHEVTTAAKKTATVFERHWSGAGLPGVQQQQHQQQQQMQRQVAPAPVASGLRPFTAGPAPVPPPNSAPTAPMHSDWLSSARIAIDAVLRHPASGPFAAPVDEDDAPNYHIVVPRPMDFGTIRLRLCRGQYPQPSAVLHDVRLVFDNCRAYYTPEEEIWSMATEIEAVFLQAWRARGLPLL